jgi:hypothetical protein
MKRIVLATGAGALVGPIMLGALYLAGGPAPESLLGWISWSAAGATLLAALQFIDSGC